MKFQCKFLFYIHLVILFHCNFNTNYFEWSDTCSWVSVQLHFPCNVNEETFFRRGVIDSFIGIDVIDLEKQNCWHWFLCWFFFSLFQKVDHCCNWCLMGNMRQYFQIQPFRMFSVHLLWRRRTLTLTWRNRFLHTWIVLQRWIMWKGGHFYLLYGSLIEAVFDFCKRHFKNL